MLTAGLIFVAVSLVLNMLSGRVLGVNMSPDEIQQYLNYYVNGDYQAILRLSESMSPPGSAYLIDLLIRIVLYLFGAGFLIFILNTVKSAGAVYGNLLDGFGRAAKLLLLALAEGLFIFLWSLLLIIPGIVAAYRYSMAMFIFFESPEKGALQCLRESKAMTMGYKGQLFVLDLSFLGWIILSIIPFVSAYVTPYMQLTYAGFYDSLKRMQYSGEHDYTGYDAPDSDIF